MKLPYSAALTIADVGRYGAHLQSLPDGGSERDWLELEHVVLEAIAINRLSGVDAQRAALMAWNAVQIKPASAPPEPGEQTRRELHGMIETLEAVAFDQGYQQGAEMERRNAETTREEMKQKAVLIEQQNIVQAEEIGLLNRAMRSVLGSRLRYMQ